MSKAYHAILDCSEVGRDQCVDDRFISRVLEEAADEIGATVIGKGRYRFGHDSPDGCTVFVMLDESHISAHTYADTGKMAVDVFVSASKDKCQQAVDFIICKLGLEKCEVRIMERFL